MALRAFSGLALVMLLVGAVAQVEAQPTIGPPFAEVQSAWTAFWQRVSEGDIAGARRYVHTSRQPRFPGSRSADELRELAAQMLSCRLDGTPVPLDLDEVMYRVVCERGDERAETLVGLRRDADGAWRFVTL